jgi:ribulose-phosphate 3-epimerase
MLVAPSILSADFGNLEREIKTISSTEADLIHVDVMDGHFVPNLTIGPVVVESVAKTSSKPLDVHLMVENNSFFVDLFAPLKPEYISFHIEEEKHPHRLIQKIKEYGIKPAIALNPATPPESIEYLLQDLDMVLIMSVNPGFGGQKFLPLVLKKIEKLKEMIRKSGSKALIQVDGGVNDKNIHQLKLVGVDIVVAGSYIFKKTDYSQAVKSLKI